MGRKVLCMFFMIYLIIVHQVSNGLKKKPRLYGFEQEEDFLNLCQFIEGSVIA